VILSQPARGNFDFPVLTGLTEDQPEASRAERVRFALQVEREIGTLTSRISEINLTAADNLRMTALVDGRALDLIVGDRNFGTRCRNFFDRYPLIRRRSPNATVFDLRLDDRITARER